MFKLILVLPLFMLLAGLWVFVSKRMHLMVMLISLEYVALTGFFLVVLLSLFAGAESYLSLIFLISSVCEGSLGVAILVGMARNFGNDYVSSLNILEC